VGSRECAVGRGRSTRSENSHGTADTAGPVLGLARSKDPRTAPLLVDLLDDQDVVAHTVTALGKVRPPGVRPSVEPLLDHPQPLVEREAKKALARLPP
jgi:HEAT repeat protein